MKTRSENGEDLMCARTETQRMLSTLSHDMKTPLESVIALAQLSLEQLSDNSAAQTGVETCLRRILAAARDMERMTDDLIDPSRRTPRKECFTAQELAESLGTAVGLRARKRRHLLKIDVSALGRHAFRGDRAALLRILMNLLDNAIKYTPEGGRISLTTRILRKTRSGVEAEFIVEDNGIGMEKSFLERMYQPYARAQEKIAGHGLGLASVKHLTERMQGSIQAQSTPGRGTRFCVRLPLAFSQDAAARLKGRLFLLAEDNDLSASVAQELLAQRGAQVTRASDGWQAVQLFCTAPEGTFDAILMDLRMPVMGGCCAAKTIRRLSRADALRIPILALTADADGEDEHLALSAGMNACLKKPLDMGLLCEAASL